MSKFNYKTSKDYKWLKKLLDSGKKVIVIDERNKAFVAYKELSEPGDNYNLGAFFWEDKYEGKHGHPLVKCCEEYGIEFIEPNVEDETLTEIEEKVVRGDIHRIDVKRVPIELHGELKHKFNNEFNTMWQLVGQLQFANVAKRIIERICLNFAAWGAYNLRDLGKTSEEERVKFDEPNVEE